MKEHKHSIYSLCHECRTWGINGVCNTKCGNCGSLDTTTYYPEECLDIAPKFTYVFEKDGKQYTLIN